jgi:SAM-dependent methyltransferase
LLQLLVVDTPWSSLQGRKTVLAHHLYQSVANQAKGEAIFVSGNDALSRFDYSTEMVSAVPNWIRERFVGIGSLWSHPIQPRSRCIVDVGCGAGLDLHVGLALAGDKSIGIGVDSSLTLVSTAASHAAESLSFVQGSLAALPLASNSVDLLLANGLPPMLGASTLKSALVEAHRILTSQAEVRFTALVVGPDQPLETLPDETIINALRIGKPVVATIRRACLESGFRIAAIDENPNPFVIGFRPAQVRSVTVVLTRGG